MRRVFFYGLFMDADALRSMGLNPVPIGPARLPGFRLHIGDRATLIPDAAQTAYGMLIELSEEELSRLYSPRDVRDYEPETVHAVRLDDKCVERAQCYNLPSDKISGETNKKYAEKLSALLIKLGFPLEYAVSIVS